MELKEPRPKHRPKGRPRPIPQHPLPIMSEKNTSVAMTKTNWYVGTGRYNGECVIVDNPQDMSRINGLGHFGKGSLSRCFPIFDKVYKGIPPFIRERQWKRRCSWAHLKNHTDFSDDSRKLRDSETLENSIAGASTNADNHILMPSGDDRFVVVVNDSDSELESDSYLNNLQPHIEKETCSVLEALHLTLEEAFFLSYALGCLRIFDLLGNKLSVVHVWRLFMESQEDFLEMYVAYHYFRAKGWVVKPGLKFGGDFLLYKQGPAFYHASYIVKVQVLNCSNRKTTRNHLTKWRYVMGLSRLAETAAKELLVCQVVWPDKCSDDALMSPRILSRFTVNEMLVQRWVAAQERGQEDNV